MSSGSEEWRVWWWCRGVKSRGFTGSSGRWGAEGVLV